MKIKVLDCTLRDGGIVIDFNFGIKTMHKIKSCLENAKIDIIECGYIDDKKGSAIGRTSFDSDKSVSKFLLNNKKQGITYVVMADYGKYDFNNLSENDGNTFDGIRLAFHKENRKDMIEVGRKIIEKGYKLFIQPMITTRYSDDEYLDLINDCNTFLPEASGCYLVDSFGQMNDKILLHYLEILDENLLPQMVIGFHSHNNRQLSFSNAQHFVNYNSKRDLIIDASIMGMGKGAGNLCTELILSYLNERDEKYNINIIFEIIGDYFSELKITNPWGYSLNYYLSSIYACTPSYVKCFLRNQDIDIDALIELLENLPADKKSAFDEQFSKQYLSDYLSKKSN